MAAASTEPISTESIAYKAPLSFHAMLKKKEKIDLQNIVLLTSTFFHETLFSKFQLKTRMKT